MYLPHTSILPILISNVKRFRNLIGPFGLVRAQARGISLCFRDPQGYARYVHMKKAHGEDKSYSAKLLFIHAHASLRFYELTRSPGFMRALQDDAAARGQVHLLQ